MGIFSGLKQKFNGQLDVKVQAPASLPSVQTGFDGTIELTAKAIQNIKSIRVSLFEQIEKRQFGHAGLSIGTSDSYAPADQVQTNTIVEVKIDQPFTMQANESKTLPFHLEVGSQAGNEMEADNPLVKSLVGVASALSNETNTVTYWVEASVDVDGAALNASNRQQITLGGQKSSSISIT